MANVFPGFKAQPNPQKSSASCGGVKEAKPLPYSPPKGPTNQTQQGPGLHGTNHGNSGTQRKG